MESKSSVLFPMVGHVVPTLTTKRQRYCTFREEWLSDERFCDWVEPVGGVAHYAYCTYCDSKFSIGASGVHDVKRHAKGKRHRERVQFVSITSDVRYRYWY